MPAKGRKKANTERNQRMLAGKAAKANQENVPPVSQKLQETEKKLQASERLNLKLKRENRQLKSAMKDLRTELRNTRQREKRQRAAAASAKRLNMELKAQLILTEKRAEERVRLALMDKSQNISHLEKSLRDAEKKLTQAVTENEQSSARSSKKQEELLSVRQHVHNLQKMLGRARATNRRQKKKTGSSSRCWNMKTRHAFDIKIRALVRSLITAGCSQNKVGRLVQDVAATFGVKLKKIISRRTAARIVLEGLVMARIQQGHELRLAKDLTLSGDSTSRRNQNYQSHHATYRVFEVLPDGSRRVVWRTRFYGIRATVDHTAGKSKESWFRVFEEIISFYNGSPLCARTDTLDLAHICTILRGMCSDHATAEKATADAMRDAKHDVIMQKLGEEEKADMPLEEFGALVDSWNAEKMKKAGGKAAWDALSSEERAVHDLATIDALIRSLGEKRLSELPTADQRLLTLFVWTGCCMHKDQNSFKGGNTAMMATWEKLGLSPPIPLANKANAAVVRKAVAPELGDRPLTDVELAALESSTRGGAKTTALAGAIFNNHNDKKGQGDTHINVMSLMLDPDLDRLVRSFPHTSNTRFGSHGEAAGELLVHLPQYIAFLEFMKTKKTSDSWTNIELNVYNALHDGPTLTELSVMALYQQLITHPYMRMVRANEDDQLNAIDLGPLHADLREHCQRLIDAPDLILDFAAHSYIEATLDGEPFERPEVIEAIAQLHREGRLANLQQLFVSFIEGTKVTWLRFSSEYAPGGVIDGMTADERLHVFLNATNDRNEGALGAWCVWARKFSTSTMDKHNAIAMYTTNDTQQFSDQHFQDADHVYVMRKAREHDASGVERRRRKEQAEFECEMVEMKRRRIMARAAKRTEKEALLASTPEVKSEEEIMRMTGKLIDLQFAKLKSIWGPKLTLPPGRWSMPVESKKLALVEVFRQHLRLKVDGASQASDSGAEDVSETVEITTDAWYEEEDEEMD
ncbi:hypothetical protein K525DRAFT_275059 [Schizophyllum commune Loenen D]|nr:hypothetical protein K525DRAFT_275059 [Schizophyllum commune Loenen D]